MLWAYFNTRDFFRVRSWSCSILRWFTWRSCFDSTNKRQTYYLQRTFKAPQIPRKVFKQYSSAEPEKPKKEEKDKEEEKTSEKRSKKEETKEKNTEEKTNEEKIHVK